MNKMETLWLRLEKAVKDQGGTMGDILFLVDELKGDKLIEEFAKLIVGCSTKGRAANDSRIPILGMDHGSAFEL